MKRGRTLALSMLLAGCLAGCGSGTDEEETKAQEEPDRIEKVTEGASKLGYDGDAIEKQLRDLESLNANHNRELDEVMND